MEKLTDIERTAIVLLAGFVLISLLFVMPVSAETGEVVAWGRDWSGQCSGTPTGTGFKQVAAGWGHSLTLSSDGSIVAMWS